MFYPGTTPPSFFLLKDSNIIEKKNIYRVFYHKNFFIFFREFEEE
jgi:hypothetical protein